MKNVFISFSSKQTDEAMNICHFIEEHGFNCFIATRDLIPGEEYAAQLLANIDEANVLVLLLSKDSNSSVQCLREIEYAVRSKTPILVYPLEQVTLARSMEYFLMTHQWITDYGDKQENLISSIERIVTRDLEKASMHCSAPSDDSNIQDDKRSSNALTMGEAPSEKPKKSSSKKALIVAASALAILALAVVLFITIASKNPNNDHDKGTKKEKNTEYVSDDKDTDKENLNDKNSDDNTNVKDSDDIGSNNNNGEEDSDDDDTIKDDATEICHYNVGDTVVFGNYYDEPIEWRVIKVNDDGTMMLISKYLLSFKVFDAAEGGEYNNYDGTDYWSFENHIIDDDELSKLVRGCNDWSTSNIRTWLNSDTEVVEYEDQAPTKKAVGNNFYSSEPGFLYAFTESERNTIVGITHDSKIDKVFLLSSSELTWLKAAGIPVYASPTDAAIANSDADHSYTSFTDAVNVDSYYWWLRDSDDLKANEAYMVATEYEEDDEVLTSSVGASNFGIRPVVCVKYDSQDITKVQ